MKKTGVALIAFLLVVILCGCQCDHVWENATCTAPKTCKECGATEGEPSGHKWQDADCTTPKTCTVCKKTEGEALGHSWKDATCTTPQLCEVCDATGDEALGHTWEDADCTHPKTCTVCKETEGKALGHSWEDATCQSPKKCKACDLTEGEKGDHSYVSFVCEHCGDEDTEGMKTSPLHSFVKGRYETEYFQNGDYAYRIVSVDFLEDNGYGEMGGTSVTYTLDPLDSINPGIEGNPDKVINGKNYYWSGGGAAYQPWDYYLTETEIVITHETTGAVVGRFTLNSDGSLYCTYGNDYRIVTGYTYTRKVY